MSLVKQALEALQRGDMSAAATHTQQALEKDIANPDAYMLFAHLLKKIGNPSSAVDKITTAIRLAPHKVPYYILHADILTDLGRNKDALDTLTKAYDIAPNDAHLLCKLSAVYFQLFMFDKAADAGEKAFTLIPNHPEAWLLAYHAYYRLGNTKAAEKILKAAAPYHGSLKLHFLQATLLPSLIENTAEGADTMARSTAALKNLAETAAQSTGIPEDIFSIPFYHSYYGLPVKPYMEQLSGTIRACVPAVNFTAPHAASPNTALKRIAFVSEYFYGHVVSKYLSPIIRALAEESPDLEFTVFSASEKSDHFSEMLRGDKIKFITLPKELPAAQRLIASHKPDILVHLDIGMSIYTYLLAHARLAPVQCVVAGHPITTGINTMDYLFSTKLAEEGNYAEDYTETAVLFEHIPIMFSPKPELPAQYKPRAELGLPADKTLYACPVYLHRIHPDMDEVFARILKADNNAEIILFGMFHASLWPEQICNRFTKNMPEALAKRIRIIPYAQGENFIHTIKAMDAILDPMHFSMGTTLCTLFAAGVPVATLPGAFMRGRFSSMLYQTAGIPDAPIARNVDEFVALALRLAQDGAYKSQIENTLLSKDSILFSNRHILDEWKQFFQTAWQKRIAAKS